MAFEFDSQWFFPPLAGGKEKGLSSAGADIFREMDSIGLESGQNCRNAAIAEEAEVTVVYKLSEINSSLFPGRDDYRQRLQSAENFFLARSSDNAELMGNEVEQLREAQDLLRQQTIPTLVISDYNTTGLIGSEYDEQSPYYRFLKSTGVSNAQGTLAGTYGHGQNALLSRSKLRAVSVYSSFMQGNETKSLFVSQSTLCTHTDPTHGFKTQDTGYYAKLIQGQEQCWEAFRNEDIALLPRELARDYIGTDIYIWGYIANEDWDLRLARSLFRGFFAAVLQQRMRFKIVDKEGEILWDISSDSLMEQFTRFRRLHERSFTKGEWNAHEISNVYGYILALSSEPTSDSVISTVKTIEGIGDIRITIYKDDEDPLLTNRWCLMRQPLMMIQSFTDNSLQGYNAVVQVLGNDGNKIIAALEDPTHTKIKYEYVRHPSLQERYKRLFLDLKRAVHDEIASLNPPITISEDVPGLANILPGVEDDQFDETFHSALGERPQECVSHEGFRPRLRRATETRVSTSTLTLPTARAVHRVASSAGSTGGSSGTHGGSNSASTASNGSQGVGDSQGNAQVDQEGRRESVIPTDSLRLKSYRDAVNKKLFHVRVVATNDILGDLRLGIALEESGDEMIPLPIVMAYDINGSQLSFEGNRIIGVALQASIPFDLKILLAADLEFAIGAF